MYTQTARWLERITLRKVLGKWDVTMWAECNWLKNYDYGWNCVECVEPLDFHTANFFSKAVTPIVFCMWIKPKLRTHGKSVTMRTFSFWLQVPAWNDSSIPSNSEAEDLGVNWTVDASSFSALWVLLIHSLGSYICYISGMYTYCWPITLTARSKAWTVFARSNTGIVGSNLTQGMDVSIACIYSVFVLFCV
jgi:hypothetical protein